MDNVIRTYPAPGKIAYEYTSIADRKRVDFVVDVVGKSFKEGSRVLDVGCGNGVISRHLGKLGYDVTGIDVSEKTIQQARALTNLPNVRFITKSAEELVAEGEKYEVVICSEVLEHLHNPGALLNVLSSILSNDGKLIVTVPNGKGPRESLVTKPILRLREKNNWLWKLVQGVKRKLGYKGTTVQSSADNLDHVQFFSKKDLIRLSGQHGFSITRFGSSNFIEDVFPFSFLTKRIKFLQVIDCKIADLLPVTFTGGFLTLWEKNHE